VIGRSRFGIHGGGRAHVWHLRARHVGVGASAAVLEAESPCSGDPVEPLSPRAEPQRGAMAVTGEGEGEHEAVRDRWPAKRGKGYARGGEEREREGRPLRGGTVEAASNLIGRCRCEPSCFGMVP
jgi:hypothetical protein